MKCVVHNCSNTHRDGEGHRLIKGEDFVWFCAPCWEFITTGSPSNSQVGRNSAQSLPDIHRNCLLDGKKKAL